MRMSEWFNNIVFIISNELNTLLQDLTQNSFYKYPQFIEVSLKQSLKKVLFSQNSILPKILVRDLASKTGGTKWRVNYTAN